MSKSFLCGTFLSGAASVLKKILPLFIFILPFVGHAQVNPAGLPNLADTTKKKTESGDTKRVFAIKTVFLLQDSMLFKPNKYTKIDTSLHQVDIIDQGQMNGRFYKRINNYGSASFNLEFNPIRQTGFNLGLAQHKLHHLQYKDLRFYNSYTPYTQFRYIQGDGELQTLDVLHSQSLTERWNLGITYHSLKSTGFYQNEANRLTNVSLHSQYLNPKGNYRFLAYAIWNTSDLNENAGVEGVEFFNSPAFASSRARLGQPVFLSNSNYWLRNSEIGFRQFRYFGKTDSIKVKGFGYTQRFAPRAYITHKLCYVKNTAKFGTNNDTFFNQNFTSIESIFEVVEHREISNELAFGLFLNKKEILLADSNVIKKPYSEQVFYGGIDVKLGRAGFWGLERLTFFEPNDLVKWWGYGNLHLFGNLSKQLTPVTHFKGDLNYVLIGSQFADYSANFTLKQVLFKGFYISPFLKLQAVSPMFLQNTYVSSYARWNNNFKKEFNNVLGADIHFKQNTCLTLTANRSDNFIFYDENAKSSQSELGINYFQIKLAKTLNLKKFHFENTLAWQNINSESPYQIPKWLWQMNYYYESPMFKNAATIRIGIRGQYYSKFLGMAYMPGIAAFYVQTEAQTGGYAAFDAYFSANVKKWNGFVKFEHASEGLMGFAYQMLPNYPMAPRALRLGVAWRFYD